MNQYEQYVKEQHWDDRFRYMLLDRMRGDCDYFLGNGRIYGNHLWAGNVPDQIGYMKALWESFPENGKPEWLTMEQILDYEQKMLHLSGAETAKTDKVVIGRPVGGISINPELEFVLDDEGVVRYFEGIEQAKALLRQDGVSEGDMEFYTFLHSCGICRRCGAPLFPSLIEGYACQCFSCDEDFCSFEQGISPKA